MTRYLFILGLITTGVILSGFINVQLPVDVNDALVSWLTNLYAWDGLLPIAEVITCAIFFLFLQIALGAYTLFKWIIG